MPASQAAAAERRNDRADESFQVTNEPPKLRTTLKTPPKQATNPLQFVKVGPCSLYRTAQEQLSKVQEVKKVKQEVRDDPEDWQSNLDNWKSSRRKRQEHIIERVVEAKKLEEEEHTRQRRKGKTFSEMIEERGNRGRKLSISLNMFNDEEGSNELSDLGTGVGSNKSSISGDTHDDNQSIFSDRDNEMEKNQSDLENTEDDCIKEDLSITKKPNYGSECDKQVCSQTYESTISDENKSSESEEYTYEGAIRTYVSRVSQNIPRNSAVSLEAKFEVVDFSVPPPAVTDEKTIPVKVNILKRREIFEKASQMQNSEVKVSNKLADVELVQSKSIKERLTNLEKIKSENDKVEKKNTNSGPKETSTVRELLSNLEKQETVKRNSSFNAEELENVLPLKERLLTLREYEQPKSKSKETKLTKEDKPEEKGSLGSLERDDLTSSQTNEKNSMPSDEYELGARISRSQFHRSLDSLDEDASSRPDSYERVQSLEELDYQKYDTFTSSNEILNDTDREDSGIHTTDVSWSVSQTDESVDDGIHNNTVIECVVDDKMNYTEADARTEDPTDVGVAIDGELISAKDTAETSSGDDLLANKYQPQSNNNNTNSTVVCSTSFHPTLDSSLEDSFVIRNSPEKLTENVATNQTEHTPKTDLSREPTQLPELITPIIIAEILKVKISNDQMKRESSNVPVRPSSKIPILVSQKTSNSLPTSPSPFKSLSFSKLKSFNSADNSPTSSQTNCPSEFPAPVSSFESPRVPSSIFEKARHPVMEDSHRADTQIAELDKTIPREVSELDDKMQLDQNGTETSLYKENNSDEEVNCRRSSTESTGSVTSNAKSSSQKVDSIKEQMIERPTSLNLMSTINKESIVPLMNSTPPVYTNQMLPLSLSSDEELLTSPTFPLGPPTSMDPPKEKPPPPPTDLSDDENRSNASLKRLNSTRRIKQELRSRRSDFLGIEGTNDEELERELTLSKPPDMAAILAEERRIDQLHCRSYDTDSNYDQDSSHERDSGVELGHVEDWTKQPISPDMSQHSRQSSEPFGASITSSEEDELQKKEQEIIDVLEKEEQWRYRNEHNLTSDIADKFGHKVIGLEKINVKLEREREKYGKSTKEKQEESTTTQQTIKNKEEQPVQKEFNRVKTHFDDDGNLEQKTDTILNNDVKPHDDEFSQREIFRVEQELLQLEQEELKRQRTHMALKEQKQQQQLAGKLEEQWKSRQEEENESKKNTQQFSLLAPLHYRTSMPNLQTQEGLRRRPPPPPPILPSKPLMLEQHREYSMRNNRIPSADSIPQQVNASLRHSASVTSLSSQSSQQMTRQTLQALSAVPRSRIVQGDQWVQRRKSDTPRGMHDCNYQHWLIQEAEQRRISEVNQKSPSRKCQQHVTGTSVLPPATSRSNNKPLPESIIRTLTQRVQNRVQEKSFLKRRFDQNGNQEYQFSQQTPQQSHTQPKPYQPPIPDGQDKVLSVSGKKKCSHCGEELGRGAAMIIESLRLFYHMECFKCCVCHIRLGDGLMGTDVRVRNHKLHCHNCYSSDDGVKFSCV